MQLWICTAQWEGLEVMGLLAIVLRIGRLWAYGDSSTDLLARSSGGITGCNSLKSRAIGR